MNNIIGKYVRFSFQLFCVLFGMFLIQFYGGMSAGLEYWDKLVYLSYCLAFFTATLSYLTLVYGSKNFSQYLGFMFLGHTLIKLVLYYLVFWYVSKQAEFHKVRDFFVIVLPYCVSLILEVYSMVKLINSEDEKRKESREETIDNESQG